MFPVLNFKLLLIALFKKSDLQNINQNIKGLLLISKCDKNETLCSRIFLLLLFFRLISEHNMIDIHDKQFFLYILDTCQC